MFNFWKNTSDEFPSHISQQSKSNIGRRVNDKFSFIPLTSTYIQVDKFNVNVVLINSNILEKISYLIIHQVTNIKSYFSL